MDRICSGDADIQPGHDAGDVWNRAVAACIAFEPSAPGRRCTRSCFEYCGVIYDEYELAIVRSRDDDELSDADAHVGLSQLLFGGSWNCVGSGVGAGYLAARVKDPW